MTAWKPLVACLVVAAFLVAPLRSSAQTYGESVVAYAEILNTGNQTYRSYNRAGGNIVASYPPFPANGLYRVAFEGVAPYLGGGPHVQLSAYIMLFGTGTEHDKSCQADGFEIVGDDLEGWVRCFRQDGEPDSNIRFTILLLSTVSPANNSLAYAFSEEVEPSGGALDLSNSITTHNPGNGTTTLYHDDTGAYRVTFDGLDAGAVSSINFQVTPSSMEPVICRHSGWANTDGLEVSVNCNDFDGNPSNARFYVLAAFEDNPDADSTEHVYAGIDSPADLPGNWVEITNTSTYNPFGNVEARRSFAGKYELRFNGIDQFQGNHLVSPGPGVNDCSVGPWHTDSGARYVRVFCVNSSGNVADNSFTILTTLVGGQPISNQRDPESAGNILNHPYPNPASGTTSIALKAERGQVVSVEVLDTMGRRIQTLYTGPLAAGVSEDLSLDASTLPAGIYVIRAMGEDFVETQRVTVVH